MRLPLPPTEQLEELLAPFSRVLSRPIDRVSYASDASHFALTPDAVVVARDHDEVAQLMRTAARAAVPVTFRSGGTSLSGQAISDSVLVDVRQGFQRIEVLEGGLQVRVQPGATVRQINARLLRHGRQLGPDPASEVACTVGGVVANNSSGMLSGTAANAYNTLVSMKVVLPSGVVFDTAWPDADIRLSRDAPELYRGLVEIRDRVRADPGSVQTILRLFSIKNTMGYGLNAFLDYDSPSEILAHLMIGSEGTLGFVAEATFGTVPRHSAAATGLLIFEDLLAAGEALPALVATGAAALELIDATGLRVSQRDADAPSSIRDLRINAHAAILVEYQAATVGELEDLATRASVTIASLALSQPGPLTTDAATRAKLWHMRKGLYASVAGARPPGTTALLEDVAVPVAALARTCSRLVELFEQYGYEDSVIFGHAKDGNIHFMLTDNFEEQSRLDCYRAFTEDMVELVLGEGGTLKAEHGTGRVMAPFVRRQYGDRLYEVMGRVKALFDPVGILNPGVLMSTDDFAHLRDIKRATPIEVEADRCVECGYCEPSCPSKNLTMTPRQRIVARRAIRRAELDGDAALAESLEKDYDYSSLQTCAVDGMCQTACPVLINTGDLVKRLRAEGSSPVDRTVWRGMADSWSVGTRAAARALDFAAMAPAPLVRAANHVARAVGGKDRIPLWSAELPGGGKSRSRAPAALPVAVYLPACVNTMFGAVGSIGVQASLERLCERVGIQLLVPPEIDGVCCGTPWSSKGMDAGARAMRERLIDVVLRATSGTSLPVISDASSCTEGFAHVLASDRRTQHLLVVDSVEFAVQHLLPSLPVTAPLASLALHPTCSSTRLGTNDSLALIAAHLAERVDIPHDWGCCGFAGDRGMLHPELTASATATQAAQVIEANSEAHVSCNRTCELGMTRATGKEYQHILELLEERTRSSTTP
ncbi:MAG: oxidoreductase [Rhodoglobus sp.]|nr:oxidoreductase [Rhodoglobus sp.]